VSSVDPRSRRLPLRPPSAAPAVGGGRWFAAVEGPPGTGKTELVARLATTLGAGSIRFPAPFLDFRRRTRMDETFPPVPRLLYYLAAALHLSGQIQERLRREPLVCDRYAPSVIGLARAWGDIDSAVLDSLVAPVRALLLRPTVTVLVCASHDVARDRMAGRPRLGQDVTVAHERAARDPAFFERWLGAMREEALELGPVIEIDATDKPPERVAQGVLEALGRFLA
jgi:thymidylate kinase